MKRFGFFGGLFTLFLFTACNNITPAEQQNEGTYIRIAAATARTILPYFDLDTMTDFALDGRKSGDDWKTLATFASYEALQTADIPIEAGSWDFKLSAKEGRAVFTSASLSTTITAGVNQLTFTLTFDANATTAEDGSVQVSFAIPSGNEVRAAKAGLFTQDTDKELADFPLQAISLTQTSDGYTANYSATDVPIGTYRLRAYFYADEACTLLVATRSELVLVIGGSTSTADRDIPDTNEVFTITYDLNGGKWVDGYEPIEKYTRYSAREIELPKEWNVSKEGYILDYWIFDDELYAYPHPAFSNMTLHAHWSKGLLASDLSSFYPSSVLRRILLQGEWKGSDFWTLASKLKVSGNFILDMSNITSITEISNYLSLFKNNPSIVSVIFPETTSTYTIPSETFRFCSNLESITLSSSITSIGSYAFSSTKITSLYVPYLIQSISGFGACKNLTTVKIAGAITIGEFAFTTCQQLSSVDIDYVHYIGTCAFNGCHKLKSITLPSSLVKIDSEAFLNTFLEEIIYRGTKEQWNNITKASDWCPSTLKKVICSDGEVNY